MEVRIAANGFCWVDGRLEQLLDWDELLAARDALNDEAENATC